MLIKIYTDDKRLLHQEHIGSEMPNRFILADNLLAKLKYLLANIGKELTK